jgi:hypothetical protein
MKWSMGIFWAVLAAYSSLKASSRERTELAVHDRAAVKTTTKDVAHDTETKNPSLEKTPPSVVQVDTAESLGLMQDGPQHQRT